MVEGEEAGEVGGVGDEGCPDCLIVSFGFVRGWMVMEMWCFLVLKVLRG